MIRRKRCTRVSRCDKTAPKELLSLSAAVYVLNRDRHNNTLLPTDTGEVQQTDFESVRFGGRIALVRAEQLHSKEVTMLWTIFVILLVMWLLGMATSYTLGGFIHILLILAIATVLIRVIQGRTPV